MRFQSIKRIFSKIIAPVSLCAILTAGCGVNRTEEKDYLTRVLNRTTISAGLEHTEMNIEIPRAYGNIPPHPDDLNVNYGPNHPCKTREVHLKSGNYSSSVLNVDVSPIPYNLLENIKVGYKGTFILSTANQIREGLSDMEWYEYGAFAGTYSRVKLPQRVDSFRISWLQPLQLNETWKIFAQPGISYDMWDVEVEGGWDRYYREQPMLRDSVHYSGWNPFIKVGIIGYEEEKHIYLGIAGFWEPEKIEGNTSYGPVKLEGTTWGIEAIVGF